jgi:hypothetical protein
LLSTVVLDLTDEWAIGFGHIWSDIESTNFESFIGFSSLSNSILEAGLCSAYIVLGKISLDKSVLDACIDSSLVFNHVLEVSEWKVGLSSQRTDAGRSWLHCLDLEFQLGYSGCSESISEESNILA